MAQEILVSINVNSGKAEARLGSVKKATDGAKASNDLYAKSFDDLTQSELEALTAELKLALQRKSTKIQVQELAAAQMRAAGANKSARAQAGLNNAILLETGRLASDASFGFTAIANNLSQVVSLTQSFVRTNGSAIDSFKQLRDSLLGAGGVMIGVQLLISFLPKIIAFFSDTTKEVNKFQAAINDATKSLDTQIETFETLSSRLQQYGDIGKLGADVNYLLAGSFSEFDKALNAIDEGALLKITDSFGEEKLLGGVEATDVLREKFLELLNVRREEAEITARLEAKDEQGNLIIRKNTELRNRLVQRTITLLRTRLELEDMLNIEAPKKAKDSAEFQIKVFESKFADFDKIEQRYRERSQKAELMTNEETLAQTQQNEMAKIDIIEEAFVRKQELRLKDYKAQLEQDIKAGKITRETADKLSSEADAKFLESIRDLGEKRKSLESEVLKFISSLRTLQIRKDANFAESQYDKMIEVERSLAFDRLNLLKIGFGDEQLFYSKKEELLNNEIKRQQSLVDATKEGTLQRANAESNLFKTQQKLRENEIAKEISFIKEKMRINEQYVSFAQGISNILETIAGENEAIQKAALIIEKGAAIAGVVVRAQQSIATARAMASAVPAILPPGIPNPAKPVAEADAARNIALTKLSSGIAIAGILATTLTSFKSPSGGQGGGGTGASVQAPAFNVVGASATNQLAQAVSNNVPQVVPVAFESDLSDALDVNDSNTGADTVGQRSIG